MVSPRKTSSDSSRSRAGNTDVIVFTSTIVLWMEVAMLCDD